VRSCPFPAPLEISRPVTAALARRMAGCCDPCKKEGACLADLRCPQCMETSLQRQRGMFGACLADRHSRQGCRDHASPDHEQPFRHQGLGLHPARMAGGAICQRFRAMPSKRQRWRFEPSLSNSSCSAGWWAVARRVASLARSLWPRTFSWMCSCRTGADSAPGLLPSVSAAFARSEATRGRVRACQLNGGDGQSLERLAQLHGPRGAVGAGRPQRPWGAFSISDALAPVRGGGECVGLGRGAAPGETRPWPAAAGQERDGPPGLRQADGGQPGG